MVDISLLSEDKPGVKRKVFILYFSRNVSLVAGGVLLFLVLVASLGLFGYRLYLSRQITAVDTEISKLNSSFDIHLLGQISSLDDQIKTVKKILDVHVDGSRTFSFLEGNTLRRVVWSSFRADAAGAELNVSGRAATYSILAQQVSHFASLPNVKGVSLSGGALSPDGGVGFSLTIEINPDEFVRP